MDVERKINLGEGVPLNSSGAANIFLNTGKKVNSPDGTVIHLKTEKPADVGVHINTTFSIASSKKIKLLFVLNFLLSIICMVISCTVAFYYWNEMIAMRRQVDTLKEHVLIQNLKEEALNKIQQSSLVSPQKPRARGIDLRVPRMEEKTDEDIPLTARRYYVEDLGENMLLIDSSKKTPNEDHVPIINKSLFNKEFLVAHFNGGVREINLGSKAIVGPWVRDTTISSKGSENKIELNTNYMTIKEGGLYFIYAQITYLTHAPSCYLIWARQAQQEGRLVAACSTGDDGSGRARDRAQITCSISTVTRLLTGDTVNVAQRELNRTLWLRPGYSYIGFLKISS